VEQENASSLLQFWMAVDNFQSQLEYDKYTAKEAQADAMILYEKFVSTVNSAFHLFNKPRLPFIQSLENLNSCINCFSIANSV